MGYSQERRISNDSVVDFLGVTPQIGDLFKDDLVTQVTSGFEKNYLGEEARHIIESGALCEAKEQDGAGCTEKGQAVLLIDLNAEFAVNIVSCKTHVRRTFVALLTIPHGKRIEANEIIKGRDDTQIFTTFFGVDKPIFINGFQVSLNSSKDSRE